MIQILVFRFPLEVGLQRILSHLPKYKSEEIGERRWFTLPFLFTPVNSMEILPGYVFGSGLGRSPGSAQLSFFQQGKKEGNEAVDRFNAWSSSQTPGLDQEHVRET